MGAPHLRQNLCRALSGVFTMEGLKAALCTFYFPACILQRRQFRLGDCEAGESAIQTHLYLGEQQDAGLVQMLEPTEMNHHLSRQFGLFA